MKMQTPDTPADTIPDPADIAIAQAETRQRRRWRWLIFGGIVSFLIGYPLSFGPLLVLERQGLLPDALGPILRIAYFPIVFAMRRVPLVYSFYEWYLGIELS